MLAYERLIRRAAMLAMVASSLSACHGGSVHTAAAAGAVLTGIEVSPSTAEALTIPVGRSVQFTATGIYSDGSKVDLTASVGWGSSDASVATVSNFGLATAVAVGTAAITATDAASGQSATVTLSAIGADLSALFIVPMDPTILKGTSLQLYASGLLSDDSIVDYTNSVWWSSSDPTIASVSATGLLTSVALGTATITAQDPVTLLSDTITVTVTDVLALAYVTLSRGSVVGGNDVTGMVYLTALAVDPIVITLGSTDTSVATVDPTSVTIDPGTMSATFTVHTYQVQKRSRIFITATDGTVTKQARLNVRVGH